MSLRRVCPCSLPRTVLRKKRWQTTDCSNRRKVGRVQRPIALKIARTRTALRMFMANGPKWRETVQRQSGKFPHLRVCIFKNRKEIARVLCFSCVCLLLLLLYGLAVAFHGSLLSFDELGGGSGNVCVFIFVGAFSKLKTIKTQNRRVHPQIGSVQCRVAHRCGSERCRRSQATPSPRPTKYDVDRT